MLPVEQAVPLTKQQLLSHSSLENEAVAVVQCLLLAQQHQGIAHVAD